MAGLTEKQREWLHHQATPEQLECEPPGNWQLLPIHAVQTRRAFARRGHAAVELARATSRLCRGVLRPPAYIRAALTAMYVLLDLAQTLPRAGVRYRRERPRGRDAAARDRHRRRVSAAIAAAETGVAAGISASTNSTLRAVMEGPAMLDLLDHPTTFPLLWDIMVRASCSLRRDLLSVHRMM